MLKKVLFIFYFVFFTLTIANGPALADYNLNLDVGWNLITVPTSPEDNSISSVLADIEGNYESVWAYSEGSWKVYDPDSPEFSDLSEMKPSNGYWVNMLSADTVSFAGKAQASSISMSSGWHLVGYGGADAEEIENVVDSISNKIDSVWAYKEGSWKVYDPDSPEFSDLSEMEVGMGVWIKATGDCIWLNKAPLTGGGASFSAPSETENIETSGGMTVEAAKNEVLVSLKADITPIELEALKDSIKSKGGIIIGDGGEINILQVQLLDIVEESVFMSDIETEVAVTSAGPNHVVGLDHSSNKQGYNDYLSYGAQVFLNTPTFHISATEPTPSSFTGDYWIKQIRADEAWDITTGSDADGATIGIVDNGLNSGVVDNDRVEKYNIKGEAITGSGKDHGTWTTALAAGNGGDSAEDAVGVAWDNKIVFVDNLYWYVDWLPIPTIIYLTDQLAGLNTAIEKGAKVINLSQGPGAMPESALCTEQNFLIWRQNWRESITSALDYARREGRLICFSAGNDGDGLDANHHGDYDYNGDGDYDDTDPDGNDEYPASPNYDPAVTVKDDDQLLPDGSSESENVWLTSALIVAATWTLDPDKPGDLSWISTTNYSREGDVVNIAAPGGYSSWGDKYGIGYGSGETSQGTSFAAPLVTGTGGLIAGLNTDLMGCEIRKIIMDTANPTPLAGDKVGAGLLDVRAAVESAKATKEAETNEKIAVIVPKNVGTSATFSVTVPDTGAKNLDVLFLVDTSGSYGDDIDTLKTVANTILTEISAKVSSAHFGVASFADFPINGYGDDAAGDEAFVLDQPITDNHADVENAIDMLNQPLNFGADFPESQLEALYQSIKQEGRDINGDGDYDDTGDIVPLSVGWRTGSQKLIILATDATFHDSDSESAYPGAGFTQTLDVLKDAGAIVIGIDSGNTRGDLQRVVDETGGHLYNLSSSGAGIGEAILDGVDLALTDVDLSVEEIGDLENFISSVTCDSSLVDVTPGQSREFTIHFQGKINESTKDLTYNSVLWVLGNGSSLLKRVPVQVTVPKSD